MGILLVIIAGCGDDGAGTDAATDGRTPTPLRIEAAGATGRIWLETDPPRLVVERNDGSVVVASGTGGPFAFGSAFGGDERFHAPIEPTPRGVTWRPLAFGLEPVDASTARIGDAEGRSATVQLSAPADGVFRLHLTPSVDVDDVALVRLLLAADDGGYYGLGERFGHADARGTIVPMQLALGGTASGFNEHHVPVPFFVSTEGYGVFVASREGGAFDVAATAPTETWATFEGGELDVYFFVDPDPRRVVAMYTRHTGLPILPPRWAYAPMHWRNAWSDGDALREDAARIRAEDIPCTSMWIDNPWQVSYNDLTFDEARFPEPQRMLDDMRAQGFVPLLWSTPYLDVVNAGEAPANPAEELYVMARDRGWLILDGSGEPYVSPAAPGSPGAMLDFTNAEAVTFWQSRVATTVDMGVRAYKLDFAEDVLVEALGVRRGLRFSDGTTEREQHNFYNVLYHTPYRRALDAGSTEGGFLLVRASAWGGQTIADIIWPGDLDNDFREGLAGEVGGLPAAVTALQSLAASGFPNFGSDTGGFRHGMPGREALLRWAEHTAFTPILQLGGSGDHHNPWLYDAEAGAIYRTLARAHMDLVPYLRMNAIRASSDGTPPVSSPALAYPLDPGSREDPYAYMLGDDIFVAPVVVEGNTERRLHFPPGRWIHWSTGAAFDGPADMTVPSALGTPPVFVRVGAVLPLLPPDVDTLVAVSDASIVDVTDRPWLRAWIIPAGRREIVTEEGISLVVDRTADGLDLSVSSEPGGLEDLRLRIDLAHADPPLAAIATVTIDGSPVMPATDAATVSAGCDGLCWFRDGDTLLMSTRASAPRLILVR